MLHEVVLALGGHPGILFSENGPKTEFVKRMHPCERALMDRITAIASYYSKLKTFIDHHLCRAVRPDSSVSFTSTNSDDQGIYLPAFCRALNEVLEPYRDELEQLEKDSLTDPYTTLSQVTFRAEKYSQLFIYLNRIVNQLMLENVRGCQILGFLRRQCSSGVDDVKDAVNHILYKCHIVFYKQLSGWLLYGHLMDDYKEFFILSLAETASQAKSEGTTHTEVSNDSGNMYPSFYNFGISFKMLPPYIPAAVAYKILFTGQTILMFGNNPQDKNEFTGSQNQCVSIWGSKEEDFLHKLQDLQQLPQFDLNKFEETINEIRTCVTEHLWQVAREKELFQQLKLIKDFYLLGRGELFLEFMRLLSPIMARTSPSPSEKEINQAFHIAARKVLLTDDSALEKLYFIILSKDKTDSKDPNWKRLKLCYRVSWPLHLLFTADILDYYNTLFKFLLRVKIVQANLHSLWINQLKSHKANREMKVHPAMRQLHTGLIFVVDNLQYYLQADVLESQYANMQNAVQNTQDFEKVQQAHASFQSNILSQTFLRVVNTPVETHWMIKQPQQSTQAKVKKRHPVHSSLLRILTLGERFCDEIRDWAEPLNYQQTQSLLQMHEELTTQMHYLIELLCSLRSEPCGEHLSKFQLRLDFNRWFSQSSSFKLPTPTAGMSSIATEPQPSTSTS